MVHTLKYLDNHQMDNVDLIRAFKPGQSHHKEKISVSKILPCFLFLSKNAKHSLAAM